jgi:hypothetical protein
MRIRTWLVSSVLVVGCGGNDYEEYFLPTGAVKTATTGATGTGGHGGAAADGGTHAATGGTADSAASGGGGAVDAGSAACREAPTWTMGQSYKAGTAVRAVCANPGGGLTVCVVGITYLFVCNESTACATYAPGADGWWGAWTLGMRCS